METQLWRHSKVRHALTLQMRYTPTGRAVTNFRVAVNRRWRDSEGRPQEKTEWFRVVARQEA